MDQYKAIILDNSAKSGIDKDILRAVIYQESEGNPNLRSPVGAVGLMQIVPATASQLGCQSGWEFDPVKNIDCGTKYIKKWIGTYNSYDLYAGYNGGYGANTMGQSSFCPGLKRWQCAFDNADLSVCNQGFVEARNYAVMIDAWVREYKKNMCTW
jgi:soluble lytic murein transglycosylase-like protein